MVTKCLPKTKEYVHKNYLKIEGNATSTPEKSSTSQQILNSMKNVTFFFYFSQNSRFIFPLINLDFNLISKKNFRSRGHMPLCKILTFVPKSQDNSGRPKQQQKKKGPMNDQPSSEHTKTTETAQLHSVGSFEKFSSIIIQDYTHHYRSNKNHFIVGEKNHFIILTESCHVLPWTYPKIY